LAACALLLGREQNRKIAIIIGGADHPGAGNNRIEDRQGIVLSTFGHGSQHSALARHQPTGFRNEKGRPDFTSKRPFSIIAKP